MLLFLDEQQKIINLFQIWTFCIRFNFVHQTIDVTFPVFKNYCRPKGSVSKKKLNNYKIKR